MNTTRKKCNLQRIEMPQVDYIPKCPILIDSANNIVAGNALYDALPETVDCMILDHVLNASIIATETLFSALPDALERYQKLDAALWAALNYKEYDDGFLFDTTETDIITVDNYDRPPEPSYTKSKRNQKEEETDAPIFSGY